MTSGLSLYLDRFLGDNVAQLTLQENGLGDLAASQPTVIKIQNNYTYPAWLRQCYPNITVIARDTVLEKQFESQVTLEALAAGAVKYDSAASLWYKTFKPAIEAAGTGVYWCVAFNEPNKDFIATLNLFYLAIMRLGVPVVIGEFSNEFNLWDVEDKFADALADCQRRGYLLGLHGYDNLLPAPDNRQLADSPWLFPNKKLKTKCKKVISECGIDNVKSENRYCPGWKRAGISVDDYAAFLTFADSEYRKDPTVIGETVFISTRNTDDADKSDYATSFRDAGKGHNPPPPCVDDKILDFNYTRIGVPLPGSTPPPVTPPPVDPPPTTTPTPPYNAVTTANLNARLGTSDTGPFLATIPSGTNVRVLATDGHRVTIEVSILAEFTKLV
jgi:hypothetical protein